MDMPTNEGQVIVTMREIDRLERLVKMQSPGRYSGGGGLRSYGLLEDIERDQVMGEEDYNG